MIEQRLRTALMVQPRDLSQPLTPGHRIMLGSAFRPLPPALALHNLSTPENHGRWSDGHSFGLSLPWPEAADDLILEVDFGVSFLPRGTLEMGLYLNGVHVQTVVLSGNKPGHVLRHPLADVRRGTRLTLTAVVFEPARPVDVDLGNDGRLLGVTVRSVALLPSPPLRCLAGRDYLRDLPRQGWHTPDTVLWAQEDEASLTLPASAFATRFFDLEIGLARLVDQPDAQVVVRSASGEAPPVPLDRTADRVRLSPPWPGGGDEDLELVFRNYPRVVVDDHVHNGDMREIGLGLTSFTVLNRMINTT